MSAADYRFCSFDQWYPLFKDVTIESEIIEIPKPVFDYLKSDRFFLPRCITERSFESSPTPDGTQQKSGINGFGVQANTAIEEDVKEMFVQESILHERCEAFENGTFDGDELVCLPSTDDESKSSVSDDFVNDDKFELSFCEFAKSLYNCFQKMGSIFPKLNWKAPIDAGWISTSGLRCFQVEDLILLLKSSTRLSSVYSIYDDAIANTELTINMSKVDDSTQLRPLPVIMIIKRWCDFNPRQEYRCYIKTRKIVAICQRHIDLCVTLDDESMTKLRRGAFQFYEKFVQPKLTEDFPDSFTMDLFYNPYKEDYRLMDFGVLNLTPPQQNEDLLLFDCHEIENFVPEDERDVLIRFRCPDSSLIGGPAYPYPMEASYGNLIELAQTAHIEQCKLKENQHNKCGQS